LSVEENAVHAESTTEESVALPRTNRIYRFTVLWGFDTNTIDVVDHFEVLIGTNQGYYTITENAGTNLFLNFSRTNWSESTQRHFIVVVAKSIDPTLVPDSPYSDEAHWPLYPPTHFELSWSTVYPSTQVQRTTNFVDWVVVANVINTNIFVEPLLQLGFYRIDKPETLHYRLFNPNP